ncbi:hypothetical protein MTO96_015621 [Rhipicephalus appendiculatus]
MTSTWRGFAAFFSAWRKAPDELSKANEALHADMTDDEVLADMDSVLDLPGVLMGVYMDWTVSHWETNVGA